MPKNAIEKKKGARRIRAGVQIFFFFLVAAIATAKGLQEAGVALPFAVGASLHAICPFGGVVSFWNLATLGTLVKKAHESSVVLAVVGIFLAVLAGPVVCGWICPFGTFQEWLAKIGRKIFGRKYNAFVPRPVDRVLRYARYAVLAWVSWATVMTGKLAFEAVDPYFALFQFWTGEVAVSAFAVLGAVVVLSLFVERPFCKYACPYGAFLGIFNLFRVFALKRDPATCISCNACSRACPMNIDVAKAGTVRDHQCITCLECTSEAACPVPATVNLAAGSYAEAAAAKEAAE